MEAAVATELNSIMLRVTTSYGHQTVEAWCLGDYAMHRRLASGTTAGEGWAVTHCPSGLLVWSTQLQEGAEAAVRWLAEHAPLASANATTMLSMRVVAPEKLQLLREQLQQIAPRWPI